MKQEWKPDEMRANAEEIREAIMPKSVTPEMVGGTLLGLVNAVGEVVEILGEIPMGHVKVKVRVSDGSNWVSPSGTKVYVDSFVVGGIPSVAFPTREFEVDENGECEFDVPIGCKYGVYSKKEGFGASMQVVYAARTGTREINLCHLPIGVWHVQKVWVGSENENDDYEDTRLITFPGFNDEVSGNDKYELILTEGEYVDDIIDVGIVVSAENTSFIIPDGNLVVEKMPMVNLRGSECGFPTIKGLGGGISWSDAVAEIKEDWHGNLNTHKILCHSSDAPAAEYCIKRDDTGYQLFIPSAGQMFLIYLNRETINQMIESAGEHYSASHYPFPYTNSEGNQIPGMHRALSTSTLSWDKESRWMFYGASFDFPSRLSKGAHMWVLASGEPYDL